MWAGQLCQPLPRQLGRLRVVLGVAVGLGVGMRVSPVTAKGKPGLDGTGWNFGRGRVRRRSSGCSVRLGGMHWMLRLVRMGALERTEVERVIGHEELLPYLIYGIVCYVLMPSNNVI